MENFRSALLLGTAVLALMATGGAYAQNITTTDDGAEAERLRMLRMTAGSTYLSPLTVAWKGNSGIGDPYAVAGAVSSVNRDEIAQFGGQNLDDVLRATPGTFTRDNVQNPGIAVNIRGMEGSGRVNMMIDGVRQNFRFTGHEAQGLTYIDPAFISSVDIRRGAVSGVGGAGALAGTANFRTLSVDDLITGDKNWGGFVTSTIGTNEAGLSSAAAAAVRLNETFAILGGIGKRNQGNYENGDGLTVLNTEQDIISGIVKAEITPNQDHSLTLGGNFYHNDFFANSYYQDLENRTFTAKYAFTPDNEFIDLQANVSLNYTKMEYDANLTGGGGAAGRVIEDNGRGFDISNTSRFSWGDVDVEANYGVEYFYDDVDVLNSAAVPDYGVNASGESSTASVFSSTKFSYGIADLTLGLRYDHFAVEGEGGVTASNPLGMPAGPYSVDRAEGRLNPKVTLAIQPVDWFQPYVTLAQTSRAPTISELLTGGQHPGVGSMSFFPNPFLEPEVSRSIEAGANFNFEGVAADGDKLSFKANYFRNYIDNYITAMMAPPFSIYFGNNPGTSIVQGVELQGAYDAGFVFASAAYTYTDSQLPSQMNGLGAQSYLPDHIFTATLGFRLLEDQNLTIGGRFYAVSDSYIGEINAAPGGSDHEPGYSLVDLFANYRFENGVELGANITNLFDTSYTPALSTPPGGSAIDTGRGRTFLLTAKATF